MENITELDIVEYTNKWNKEREERAWKNEPKFINFLEFLLSYVKEHKVVDSDEFFYKKDKCKPLTADDFEWLLDSLCEKVLEYSSQNHIDSIILDTDYNESDYVRIEGNIYKVEVIYGQGSFSRFSLVDDSIENMYDVIDYDLMMKGEPSRNYKDNLEKKVFKKLDNIKTELQLESDVFNECIRKYLNI